MELKHENIKALAEKFWSGETSVEEERALRKFFADGGSAEGYDDLAEYFTAVNENSRQSLDAGFDRELFERMGKSQHAKLILWRRIAIAATSAAAIFIVAILILTNRDSEKNNQAVVAPSPAQDAEMLKALDETKSALSFISDKLNKGRDQTMLFAKFNKAEQQIRKGIEQ